MFDTLAHEQWRAHLAAEYSTRTDRQALQNAAYRPAPEDLERVARLDRRNKPIPHIERLVYSGAISASPKEVDG